jgi:hypothetical protein
VTERWRRELAGVDEISPDVERIRRGAADPPISHARSEPHRSRLVAGVTALVVFLLGVSLYVIPAVRGPNGEPSPTPSASHPAGPFFVPGAPKAAAIAEANKLIGLTYVPPGSEPRNHSPVRATNSPLGGTIACATDPCPYPIQTTRWWLMPLPMDEALSLLQSHPPVGLYPNGDSGTSSTGAVSWTYQAGPSPVYTQAELSLTVARWGANKSVLRADGQLLWVPPRTAAERLPDNVEQVQLESYEGDALVARTTVRGEAAQELAGLLNYLGRINMGRRPMCRFNGMNQTHYTMTFPTDTGTFVFRDWPGGCSVGSTVFVKVNGRAQPPLASGIQVGSAGVVWVSPIEPFVDCLLSHEANCKPWLGPDTQPTDPVQAFCGGLHQFSDWFSTDVAQANGDDNALATGVKGQLGGVMMWFTPSQQQIADPQIRSEAGRIVADALAVQTWTASSGAPFGSMLDVFNADSAAFVGRYCV